MISVAILGGGNVASHLINTFLKSKKVNLKQVYSRSIDTVSHLDDSVLITNNLNNLVPVDVSIIAISDDAIAEFSSKLNSKSGLIVHTSGSVSLDDLQGNNTGVFYPLQTFSKDKKINFKKIPICIETKQESDLVLLEKLASAISNNVYMIDSNQRKSLHLAAVFVNNFTNHLFKIGEDICESNTVPFEILLPLINETVKKTKHISPIEAQTGPARRKDLKTINYQLEQLNSEQQKIYTILTESIINTYK